MIEKTSLDLFKLQNKVVIVTGAGLLGSEIIKALAETGAKVIIAEYDDLKGKILEKKCLASKLDVIFKKTDITNEESVNTLLADCIKNFGKIDALVNTAYPRTKDWGKKEQLLNFDSWKKNVEMHLGGYYLTSIKVAEVMKEQKFGSIVNFSSIYGINAPDFSIYENTNMTTPIPYVAIKGGINMLTKYIASYYGKYNIRANVIAPGGVYDNQPEEFVKKYIRKISLGRMANPIDIIGPVVFLVSEASSYITGQILIVDGGWIL